MADAYLHFSTIRIAGCAKVKFSLFPTAAMIGFLSGFMGFFSADPSKSDRMAVNRKNFIGEIRNSKF